jgi:hypothetical protein
MMLSFERLGWLKCGWSGFRFYFAKQMDGCCGGGFWYSECAVVIGFWVYQFRIWVKQSDIMGDQHDPT